MSGTYFVLIYKITLNSPSCGWKTVFFKLVGSDKINPRTEEPTHFVGLSLPGQTSIKDPATGLTYILQNVVSQNL
jgi:hypothetical protein